MKELQRKQKIRRIIYSIPSLVILSVFTVFFVKGALGVISKELASSRLSKDLEEQTAALMDREQKLKGEVARLQTEEGIKDEIRERFNVAQKGEHVAVIINDKGTASSTDGLALPWYKRLWFAIIGGK